SESPPNSISPPNIMSDNLQPKHSFVMFVTGDDWGQGEFSFDFWTDINPDDADPPYHEIDIFWTDDPVGGTLNFDTDLGNTGGLWDDHTIIVPEGRHSIIISYLFNPTEAEDLMPPDDYMGNLYIDNVKYTQFGTMVPTPGPTEFLGTNSPSASPTKTPTCRSVGAAHFKSDIEPIRIPVNQPKRLAYQFAKPQSHDPALSQSVIKSIRIPISCPKRLAD
ncbi:hypothetical protein THAOC_14283, partial [Thalassiosira oceanica]